MTSMKAYLLELLDVASGDMGAVDGLQDAVECQLILSELRDILSDVSAELDLDRYVPACAWEMLDHYRNSRGSKT